MSIIDKSKNKKLKDGLEWYGKQGKQNSSIDRWRKH